MSQLPAPRCILFDLDGTLVDSVADIAAYMLQTGQRPPSGDTGDYCRARAKLNLTALQLLARESCLRPDYDQQKA